MHRHLAHQDQLHRQALCLGPGFTAGFATSSCSEDFAPLPGPPGGGCQDHQVSSCTGATRTLAENCTGTTRTPQHRQEIHLDLPRAARATRTHPPAPARTTRPGIRRSWTTRTGAPDQPALEGPQQALDLQMAPWIKGLARVLGSGAGEQGHVKSTGGGSNGCSTGPGSQNPPSYHQKWP